MMVMVAAGMIVGCSDNTMESTDAPRVFNADEITLLRPNVEIQKNQSIDEDHLIQVLPDEMTMYREGLLGFKAHPNSVDQPVDITAAWMGDDDAEPLYGFDFGPEGLQFNRSVKVWISMDLVAGFEDLDSEDLDDLESVMQELLFLYDLEDGTYEEVPYWIDFEFVDDDGDDDDGDDDDGDDDGMRIRVWMVGTVDHFSKYIVGNGPPGGGSGGGE